jgi:tetratricopeptide (TPR) repeat protein
MRLGTQLSIGLWLIASPALAAAPATAKELIREGERLYAAAKYREAAETLLKAHELDPNPRLVYNIARAYDQAGELKKSLDYYQQYVSSVEGTDPKLLKRSALSIDRIKGLIAKDEEAARARQVEQQRLADAQSAQKRAEEQAEAVRKAQEEAEAKRQAKARAEEEAKASARARSKTAFFAVGGLGVAAAASGGVFGYLAKQTYNQFHDATSVASKLSLESQAKRDALFADIGFGVGIAAAAAAVFLYPRGVPEPKKEVQVVWGLSPAGASVRVSF